MSRDDLYEELSMLLEGDLDRERTEALRARIASEPEVARMWRTVQAVSEQLAGLPDSAPPAELDAAVLSGAPGEVPEAVVPRSGRSGWAVAGWLAAAASLLLWLAPGADPVQLILADGSQWVDGHALVYAGDQLVEVDGSALISVEPPQRDLRVVGVQTEDAMQKRDVLVGALAGAVVTVAVYQGAAKMWPAGADRSVAVAIDAGHSKTVGVKRTPDGLKVERSPAPVGESAEQAVARLTQERDALAQALEESKFEGALTRGQLAAVQGDPIPWDDTIPREHRPEAVEKGIDEFLAEHPEIALVDLDCQEFPCIATFTPTGAADPMDVARGLPKEYAGALFGDGSAVMASVTATEGDDGVAAHRISIAAVPEDRRDGDWATRAQYRTEQLAGGMDAPGGQQDQDVDIH